MNDGNRPAIPFSPETRAALLDITEIARPVHQLFERKKVDAKLEDAAHGWALWRSGMARELEDDLAFSSAEVYRLVDFEVSPTGPRCKPSCVAPRKWQYAGMHKICIGLHYLGVQFRGCAWTALKADRVAAFALLQVMEYAAVAELACTLNGTRNPADERKPRTAHPVSPLTTARHRRHAPGRIPDRPGLGETSKQVGGLDRRVSVARVPPRPQALFQPAQPAKDFQTRLSGALPAKPATPLRNSNFTSRTRRKSWASNWNTARVSPTRNCLPANRAPSPAAARDLPLKVRRYTQMTGRLARTSQTGHAWLVPSAQPEKVSTEDFRQAGTTSA